MDADLAEIHGVSTKALNQAVKRNAERFPEDFRFQLTAAEREEVVTTCDHVRRLKFQRSHEDLAAVLPVSGETPPMVRNRSPWSSCPR